MRLPHPIRARRQRWKHDAIEVGTAQADALGAAFASALKNARPKIDYTVHHAPRPKPNQIQIKGYLQDGQPVYIDAIALSGQRIAVIPMRPWLVGGDNPLDRLEIVFDYFN